jgi:fructose-bisphosphate aldolase class 1
MHEHILKEMAKSLEEAGLLIPVLEPEMAVKQVVDCMKKSWEDKIAVVWDVHDVKSTTIAGSDLDVEDSWMTDEEAREILQEMDHRHDASIGISWDVIEVYVDDLKYKKKQEGKNDNN